MNPLLRRFHELFLAVRRRPDLRDLYVASRDIGILRLNVKQFGYQLARQLEGRLQGVDSSLEPRVHGLVSKATTQRDMESAWFSHWCKQLKIAPLYHRKLWEYAWVLQCLYEQGMLRSGVTAIGFGCGEEPMASYFASLGLDVLVTDLDAQDAARKGWVETSQHARSLESAFRPELVAREVFDAHVRHRVVDMNAIPEMREPYDFCWSICAMEHLGDIEAGLEFVVNALKVVKPGGLSVHTTEFNYLSEGDTRETGEVVLFLRRHFEELAKRLRAAGHELLGPDFTIGDGVLDTFIDVPPYSHQAGDWLAAPVRADSPAHLKLSISGYAATCFGLVVRKAGG